MESEAEQGLDNGSELKDEVKCEDDGTGEVVASLGQDGSGDGHEEDVEANEGESMLQEDQGAGDCHANEETKTNDAQAEGGIDGGGEGGDENAEGERESQANNANAIEPEGTSEETVEQGEVQIEEELKRSKKGDEGDEVVSSKVTTVSFASEVQVLNEDELEEQWPIAEGDDGGVVAEKGDGDGEGIVEPDENKAEIDDNSADVITEADPSLGDDKAEVVARVLDEEDGDVLEDTPVAEPGSDQPEPSDIASAENTAPSEEAVAEKTPEESNEVTTEHDDIGEQELPEMAPLSDTGVDNEASVEDGNSSEQVVLEAEQAEGNREEILDDIPVAQLIEEPEREVAIEYETVVHRSMKSSAPEVTLEAAAEEIIEQVGTSAEGPEEGDGDETKEDVHAPPLEEIEAEHYVAQTEVDVQRSYMSNAPEHGVEALVMEEQTSEEAQELNSPVPVPEGDEAGKEAHVDDNQQELLDGIPEENIADDGAVDNRTELQVDSALESQIFEESQDEPYQQDLTVPTGSVPYETDPNLSSVNQEDVPTDGNFSEYDQPPMLAIDVEPLPPIEPEMVRHDIRQLQERQRMEGLSPIELLTQANQAHGVLPSPLRSPYHQQHPHSGSKLESTSRATNLSRVQIARIPSPPAHVKAQMMMEEERRASTRTSSRLPPSVMKMSSVMVNARKKAVKNRNASVYYEEKQFHKILTLDECINSRPPMQFDLDTPGPCRYSPRNKPLYEDNAPEYTFGTKFPERAGGGRTAYSKTWFNSTDNFTSKTRFERRWPSPNAYGRGRSMVGRKVPDKKDYPAFSMRGKTNFVINKKGSENEPGPDQYHRQRSDPLLFRRAPAFSMGAKLNRGRLFGAPEITPAPNYYNPHTNYTSRKVTYPAFTISGIRKPKSHALGPHATL